MSSITSTVYGLLDVHKWKGCRVVHGSNSRRFKRRLPRLPAASADGRRATLLSAHRNHRLNDQPHSPGIDVPRSHAPSPPPRVRTRAHASRPRCFDRSRIPTRHKRDHPAPPQDGHRGTDTQVGAAPTTSHVLWLLPRTQTCGRRRFRSPYAFSQPQVIELFQSGHRMGDEAGTRNTRGSRSVERGVRRLNSAAREPRWSHILPHSTCLTLWSSG